MAASFLREDLAVKEETFPGAVETLMVLLNAPYVRSPFSFTWKARILKE